ncbi:MAG: glycoside hydrolase family 3 N-terminal domain-containing protein [Treponemataceae bacterium]
MLVSSCAKHDKKSTLDSSDDDSSYQGDVARTEVLTSYIETLSVEEKIAQLFMVGIEGNEVVPPSLKQFFSTYAPGSIIFFSYNIPDSADKLTRFTTGIQDWFLDDTHKAKSLIPPFLVIDHEGGYVNRLRRLAHPLPSAQEVAQTLSVDNAFALFLSSAQQLQSWGFHINLAPVVEVETPENAEFLDTRSFGDFDAVVAYARAFIDAHTQANMLAVAKHFPGNTNTDPHRGLPVLSVSSEIFEDQFLQPFAQTLSSDCGVLISHVLVPHIDKDPACLSKKMITGLLREKLGFEGLIFSDDIFMDALVENGYPPAVSVVKAIEAGVNIIMLSTKDLTEVISIVYQKILEDIAFEALVNQSVEKILRAKINLGLLQISDSLVHVVN